ncbi:MAG: hypothetical protein H6597_06145 [Flavobacteriales bacterium]|nr:hypothetical protein [Flavobacteriales bacterium]MCB9194097.1 hypothetical protein [Flavobacteriales bacterium]
MSLLEPHDSDHTGARHWTLLSLLIIMTGAAQAQVGMELVPNGGFEQIDGRVKTWDQVRLATGWDNVTLGLSEVFDKEASPKSVGIPDNDYGHMEPEEGEHYAGFFAWKDDGTYNPYEEGRQELSAAWNVYAEYLQTELKVPLEEGHTYALTMYVALAGNSDRAVSSIGAYCSPLALHYSNRRFLQEKCQVYDDKILDDKEKWVKISGTFEADGGETYLIVGTYPYVGFNTEKIVVDEDNQYAYYYVDGISLKEVVPGN